MTESCSRIIDIPRDKTIIIMTASPSPAPRSQLVWGKVWGRTGHCLLYFLQNANPEARESNLGDQVWIFDESIRYLKISHQSEEAGKRENSEMIWHLKSQELKTRERLTNSMRRWTLLYAREVWGLGDQGQGYPLLSKLLSYPWKGCCAL